MRACCSAETAADAAMGMAPEELERFHGSAHFPPWFDPFGTASMSRRGVAAGRCCLGSLGLWGAEWPWSLPF